jgi:hypothetical protein
VDGLAKEQLREPGPEALYDRESDPAQEKDVLQEHQELARELRARFIALLRQWRTDPAVIALWE